MLEIVFKPHKMWSSEIFSKNAGDRLKYEDLKKILELMKGFWKALNKNTNINKKEFNS